MSEIELETLQAVMAMADVQATHVSIYLTIVFAYIVVAYVAGEKLTKLQLGIATFVFVAACFWELLMITAIGEGAARIGRPLMQASDIPVFDASVRRWFSRVLWSSGMFAALVFMWTCRHPSIERRN